MISPFHQYPTGTFIRVVVEHIRSRYVCDTSVQLFVPTVFLRKSCFLKTTGYQLACPVISFLLQHSVPSDILQRAQQQRSPPRAADVPTLRSHARGYHRVFLLRDRFKPRDQNCTTFQVSFKWNMGNACFYLVSSLRRCGP